MLRSSRPTKDPWPPDWMIGVRPTQTGSRSRLMLDIGGYRARRRAALADIARSAAAEVRSSGAPVRLEAMNPFERKVVHDAIAAIDGVRSESEGEEPDRRVVVLPE